MSVSKILRSVADQVNAGALGPDVTASVSGATARDIPSKVTFEAGVMPAVKAIGQALRGDATAPKPTAGSLPEKLLEKFRQHRGENDDAYWAMGDDIDEAVVESAGRLTQNAVYGIAVREMEVSRAEVRVLHETARATDEKLRDEFADILTHSHYRVLRYIEDRSVQRGYLRWCLESADAFGGRPAPASVLAKKVQKELGIEPPEPTVGEILERATAQLDRAFDADPMATLRELGAYVARREDDPDAKSAVSDLRFAAFELRDAAQHWGKDSE
jgi:hypothetical protein